LHAGNGDNAQQQPNSNNGGSDGEGSDTSWSVSGSYYDRDQQQTTYATLGAGTITVREDAETGHDSTAGLNRDTSQSQVMIRDDETEIDLYVSSDSVNAARGLFQTDEDGNNVTLTRWQNNVTSLVDPDAYARIGTNLHELSQVDGEALAAAWEEAKTTLGLVKVEVPDTTLLDENMQAKIAAANEQGLPVEYLGLSDGELQAVVIGNDIDVVGDQAVAQMTENIAVYEASGQRVDNAIALEQQFNQDMALFDAELQRNVDESFYGALGQSNMNNRDGYGLGLDLDSDAVSLNNYSEWRQPDIEAFVSTYGPRNNVGDVVGDVRDIGMTLGGGFGHFVYDGTTDLMGMGLTAGQLYLNPMDGVSAVSNGTSAGNQFTTWAQGNTDALVASFGPSPFIGGYGNEDLRDAYDYATLFTGAATATYGRKVGSVFDDVVTNNAKTIFPDEYGVAFFGRDNLRYYAGDMSGNAPALGKDGSGFFVMPLSDSARVVDNVSAAIQSGMAPSAERAWLGGGDLFGVSIPMKGLEVKLPTAADANGWRHFLEGGQTAVNVKNTDWFLQNTTREFVIPGGQYALPKGTTVFRVGEQGERIPLWKH
jgi:hypothetical protein